MNLQLRPEAEADHRIVEELVREAFWNLYVPGCDEHYLAHTLRRHPDFIRELDFVALLDGKIVGNIMYARSQVVDEHGTASDTLTFGPVCVLPEHQGKGVGSALIRHTIGLATGMGEKAVIILGHPRNYCRHGFRNGRDFLISDSEGRYPFGQLALELQPGFFGGRRWKVKLSNVYYFEKADAEEFDRHFQTKKKEYRHTHEEFSIACRAYLD